jgi:hypothetical protein
MLCGMLLSFVPTSSVVLTATGIYDKDFRLFEVQMPDVVYAMGAVGIPFYDTHGIPKPGESPIRFAAAYVRYNFGGVKLLCGDGFDMASVTQDEINAAHRGGRSDPYRLAGNGCVPVKSDDLIPIRRK